MRFFKTTWTHRLLMAWVLFSARSTVASGQEQQLPPPPAPAAETGEFPNPVIPNQPMPACQADMGYQPNGQCQYCEPTYCESECNQSHCGLWARWKAKQQAKWWGYPEDFEELPFGALTSSALAQPVCRGNQARLALYRYDFAKGSDQLNAAGRRRLARLAPTLQAGWGPLIVEETVDAELDQKRRAAVLQELSLHYPGPSVNSVVVGAPIGAGLNGVEGQAINRNLMNQTGTRGARPIGGTGLNRGFTPSGGFSSSGSGSGSSSGSSGR